MTRGTNYPVAVFNCVSTALDMLKFSTDSIIMNAGVPNFYYVIVTWNPSFEVQNYLDELSETFKNKVSVTEHKTNPNVGYVPNLRAMMNDGFDRGFELSPYCGLLNTDMYFGQDWLKNLVKYVSPDEVVNSVHITPVPGSGNVVNANLGIPTYPTFNFLEFQALYHKLYKDELEHEDQRGGWRATNTMPYLFHSKVWRECGPWDLTLDGSADSPDRKFFQRVSDAGYKFTMSHGSIVYHHEGVERGHKGQREVPAFAKGMRYE